MKKKFWIIITIVVIITICATIASYTWFLWRMDRVDGGFARTGFPYSDFTQAELGQMYPQTVNEDVVTTQTPEQTHQLFLANLKDGKLDEAVECCVVNGSKKEIREIISGAEQKGMLDLMIGDLSEIEKEFVGDTLASYSYSGTLNGVKVGNLMSFIKNNHGIWLIKSF